MRDKMESEAAAAPYLRSEVAQANRLVLEAFWLIQRLTDLDPEVVDARGQTICRYSCGYGTMDGVEDEVERYTHRDDCPYPTLYSLARAIRDWAPEGRPSAYLARRGMSPEERSELFRTPESPHGPEAK